MMNKFEEEVIKKHSEELDVLREMSDPHIRILYHDPACIVTGKQIGRAHV